jgi:beta-1,4-mannosyltransferase
MHPANVPADDNQFIKLLVDSLVAQDIEVVNFSWKIALFSKYDVMHVHWPESLVSSSKKIFSLIKYPLTILLILRLRIGSTPLVWTVHNLEPHEKRSRLYYLIHKYFGSKNSFKIYMQKSFPPGLRNCYIPHGSYNQLFQRNRAVNIREKSFTAVSFGNVRPYKNLENLIKHFPSNLGTLVVAGKPITPSYGNHLQDCLLRNNAGHYVSLNLNQLSERELLDLTLSSEVAIFTYKDIYNSGAVLLALSAPIPAIVTDSASMRDLQAEVGRQWLQIIPAEFDALDLRQALETLRVFESSRGQRSPLSELRGWNFIAKEYLQIYKRANKAF